MAISHIDFHTESLRIRVGGGNILIWKRGDFTSSPIEIKASEMQRMLRVATEQIDNTEHSYADAS